MSSNLSKDLLALSVAERIQLAEDLWDSVVSAADDLELTDAQKAELDRRLDRIEREGPTGTPWETVRKRLFGDE